MSITMHMIHKYYLLFLLLLSLKIRFGTYNHSWQKRKSRSFRLNIRNRFQTFSAL